TRALVQLVVVSNVRELLSVCICPREPHDAGLPVLRHSEHGRHYYLAGFRGDRVIGAVIDWLIGQHVEGWTPFNWVWLAIEFPHPSPVDGFTILIHSIHRALYHITFGWGIGDHGIFGCPRRELRSGFVELPSAHERIGSKGGCVCC